MTVKQSVDLLYHDGSALARKIGRIDQLQAKIVERSDIARLDEIQLRLQELCCSFGCLVDYLDSLDAQ